MKMSKKKMEEVAEAAKAVRALCNPIRMKILAVLDKQAGKPVIYINKKLKVDQPVVSQHIKILKEAGCLESSREGKFIYYEVNYKRVKALNTVINGFNFEGA